MEELYEAIEARVKGSGYPGEVSGAVIYNDICDEIEGRDNGTYLLVKNKGEGLVFSYQVTVMDEDFNLSWLHISGPDGEYRIDFD